MQISLFNNTSERNAINKNLINEIIITGTLRDESNIHNPVMIINRPSIIGFNYAYIPDFYRYYYIEDITSVRTGLWRLTLKCDVLMSFKSAILNSYAIIDHTKSTQISEYMQSNIWRNTVKDFTEIINFPSGLLETGEYILITAGGNS